MATQANGDSATSVVHTLPATGFDPRLCGVRGTIQFDVAGAGTWRLAIDDGHTELLEDAGPCELTIACDETDFVGLLRGEKSLLTAVLRGDVEVAGDLVLALRFHGLSAPAPESTREVSP